MILPFYCFGFFRNVNNIIPFSESREGYVPGQFLKPPVRVPWKAIIYAFILFVFGTVLLTVGCLIGKIRIFNFNKSRKSILQV